mmetsp:Transcript_83009/g.146920  ORF Transcript_83009/g.146920 Transcript_83009/m.146920 type:complete len:112 (+) Transcript_83009:541-876(+)
MCLMAVCLVDVAQSRLSQRQCHRRLLALQQCWVRLPPTRLYATAAAALPRAALHRGHGRARDGLVSALLLQTTRSIALLLALWIWTPLAHQAGDASAAEANPEAEAAVSRD